MASSLVLYGTGEGQTAAVTTRISDVLDDRGHDTTAVDAETDADSTVDDFDAVVVGASVHAGTHQPAVGEFVHADRDALATKPTAFFQVSLSSATEEGAERAAGYVEDTGWHPGRIGLFGGALRYSEYGFLKRLFIKQIAKRAVPGVDTSRDVEFTDWNEVEAFAADVAAFVEGRLRIVPPNANTPDE